MLERHPVLRICSHNAKESAVLSDRLEYVRFVWSTDGQDQETGDIMEGPFRGYQYRARPPVRETIDTSRPEFDIM